PRTCPSLMGNFVMLHLLQGGAWGNGKPDAIGLPAPPPPHPPRARACCAGRFSTESAWQPLRRRLPPLATTYSRGPAGKRPGASSIGVPSHRRTVPSVADEASSRPSGLKASPAVAPVCPRSVSVSWPFAVSHILMVWSSLAEARRLPSGRNTTLL